MEDWVRQAKDIVPYLAISLLGGIANIVIKTEEKDKNLTIGFILGELFLSVFASVLVVFLLKDFGAGEYQIGIACGLTGLSARRLLVLLKGRFLEKIKNIK